MTTALAFVLALGGLVSCGEPEPDARDPAVTENREPARKPRRRREPRPPSRSESGESNRADDIPALLRVAIDAVDRAATDDPGGRGPPQTAEEWLERTADIARDTLTIADESLPELDPDLARRCGDSFRQEILSSHPASGNGRAVRFVTAAWRDVLEAARQDPREFRLTVVDDPEINAFAFVGRNVVVNTGFVEFAMGCDHPQDVMRFALAHELAHVLLGHTDAMFRRMQAIEKIDPRATVAAGLVEALIRQTPINQAAERAADCYARRLHLRQGWSLDGGKEFFSRMMRRANAPGQDAISCLFRSHPDDARRIELLETGRGCSD